MNVQSLRMYCLLIPYDNSQSMKFETRLSTIEKIYAQCEKHDQFLRIVLFTRRHVEGNEISYRVMIK